MEKQIEEMARILCGQVKSCTECSVHKPCLMVNCATILTDKGYRKASDAAREIFEEAEKVFMASCISLEAYTEWQNLKKKYTEEGK